MNPEDVENESESNADWYGNAPGPLDRMHLPAYAGLPLAGYLVAFGLTGETPWPLDTCSFMRLGAVGVLLIIAIVGASTIRNNLVRTLSLGLATSLGFVLGAVVPVSYYDSTTVPYIAIAAGILGIYTFIQWLWLGNENIRLKDRAITWTPALLASLTTAGTIAYCGVAGKAGGWAIGINCYLLIWTSVRTFYFCNAISENPSRPRMAQACSEMLRGLIIIESSLIIGFSGSPEWTIGALLAFFGMPLAAKLSPWKIKRR